MSVDESKTAAAGWWERGVVLHRLTSYKTVRNFLRALSEGEISLG